MTPLEIAAKAYRGEESLWHVKEDRRLIGRDVKLQFIVCRHQKEVEAFHLSSAANSRCYELRSLAAMRIAFLAFADAIPTEGMLGHCQAYIRIAANEKAHHEAQR